MAMKTKVVGKIVYFLNMVLETRNDASTRTTYSIVLVAIPANLVAVSDGGGGAWDGDVPLSSLGWVV